MTTKAHKTWKVPAKGATFTTSCSECGAECPFSFCEEHVRAKVLTVWSAYEPQIVTTGLDAIAEKEAFHREMDA